ncbi:ATP-binding domain-containing protein [Phycicoccus endophyticus]|uniref:ATP-binding domain-containing protein n=1 Tax=Phycicoccus endophyticus TaxID=1690220 RepID=A0A7G9R5M7_9MICO|nr:ATP-binding domain-containing protein [Phycicoccus endophyticus]QNN50902.1 ATP-binding domain-containing protein [Phycicoccus endophyticus]
MTTSSPDTVLAAERAHLEYARDQLRRMQASAASLDASTASDPLNAAVLSGVLARRVASLQEDPSTTLFFGRMDQRSAHGSETFHIGRRHVSDVRGDPVVVDWRAPVSTAFYRASATDPMGVELRRRFGVDQGRLTAYEDEHLTSGERSARSALLAAEVERPRSGPMRDIVSTIQPEQDEVVRSDLGRSLCVQGAPGTGKTAVGLHRAAWLLYSFRGRLERSGVLVVGPNRAFLEHVGAVLPSLGEVRVRHATVDALLAHDTVRAEDSPQVALLKGDERMAEVLRRAVWQDLGRPREPLVLPRGARRWQVPASEVQDEMDALVRRGLRYSAARELLPRRLAHLVMLRLERSGDFPGDRAQEAIARSAPVRAYAAALWPALDPATLLARLLSDADALAAAADGLLTEAEQHTLRWSAPPRSARAARWSRADMALLDELADLLERTPSLGHVVLDEAQDLSPMQLRAVGRRASTGSITVLGDLAQGTTPWAATSWREAMGHLGRPEHELVVLDRGFRVPGLVIDFAARLLPVIAPGLGAPRSVRDNPGRLDIVAADPARRSAAVVEAVGAATGEPGSVGVIVPDAFTDAIARALERAGIAHGRLDADHGDDEDRQVELVPASIAKGLEFDRVVVVEPSAIAAAEPDERTGLRRLYVVLTRAVSGLTVVHSEPLPGALGAG